MTSLFEQRPEALESAGMQWQAVESSQIEAIGYESGAEYPLGIQFPPTKKQKAAGEPGSEYRYKNAEPSLFTMLLGAKDNPLYENSIGRCFRVVVKEHPEKYPYVKVEAENPPQPPSSPSGKADSSGDSKSSAPPEISPETSTTSIVLSDSLAPEILFTPGKVTDAYLAEFREGWLAKAKGFADISTEEKRTELKRFARPLQKLRTGIEAKAKEYTGETKRKLAAIDAEKRRLVLVVGGVEGEVLRPLTEWEQEEESRKIRLSRLVQDLATKGSFASDYRGIPELELAITKLESFDVSTMQEYKVGAESAIAASLRVLKPELARRQEAERNAAELAELRRKQAERDEADRKAEAQRQEEERIAAAKKLADEQVAKAVGAAKVETRREVIAELAVSTDTAPLDDGGLYMEIGEKLIPVQPYEPSEPEDSPELRQATGFDSRPVVEEEPHPALIPAIPAPATHADNVNWEAIEDLMGLSLTKLEALTVVEAVSKGLVRHMSINY